MGFFDVLSGRPTAIQWKGKYNGLEILLVQYETGLTVLIIGEEEIFREKVKEKVMRDRSVAVRINGKDSKVTLTLGAGFPALFINNQPIDLQVVMPSY